MNITYLTYDYDVYHNGKKLYNILNIEYEVLPGVIGDGHRYMEISITYMDDHIKHIKDISSRIAFVKRNESSRPRLAKEEE